MGDLGIGRGRCPLAKMVSVEALMRIVIGRKAFLEIGEEDPSLDRGYLDPRDAPRPI